MFDDKGMAETARSNDYASDWYDFSQAQGVRGGKEIKD